MPGLRLPAELQRCCDTCQRVRFRPVVAMFLFFWLMFPVSAGADHRTMPPSNLPERQGKHRGQHSPTHSNWCQELRCLTACFLCSRINGPSELGLRCSRGEGAPEGAAGKACDVCPGGFQTLPFSGHMGHVSSPDGALNHLVRVCWAAS